MKLWIAKAWMYLLLGVGVLLLVGSVVLLAMWLIPNIDWKVTGILTGIIVAITAIIKMTNWADKYIDDHGGWKSDR